MDRTLSHFFDKFPKIIDFDLLQQSLFLKVLQRLSEFVKHYKAFRFPPLVFIDKIECSVHLYSSPCTRRTALVQ